MKIQGSPQLSLCCLLFALPLAAKTCHRKEEPVPKSLFLTRADSNLIPCRNQVPIFVQNFGLCQLFDILLHKYFPAGQPSGRQKTPVFCQATVAENVLHHTYPLEYQICSSQPRQKLCCAIPLCIQPLRKGVCLPFLPPTPTLPYAALYICEYFANFW